METNHKNYSKKEITPIDRLGAPVAARAYELGTADVELGYRLGSGPWEETVEAREQLEDLQELQELEGIESFDCGVRGDGGSPLRSGGREAKSVEERRDASRREAV